MPTRTAYPTGRDLYLLLNSHGLTLTRAQENQLADQCATARREFERRCDRVFLAATATKRFDPPTNRANILLFGTDLATVTTVSYQPTGNTALTWTAGTDYDLLPLNGADEGRPYHAIRLYGYRWLQPLVSTLSRSIYVTGTWGWGASIPADAWDAILWGAAVEGWTQINHLGTGGIAAWTDGDRRVEYERGGNSPSGFELMLTEWRDRFNTAVLRYRRYAC